jgi:hypothetical protein
MLRRRDPGRAGLRGFNEQAAAFTGVVSDYCEGLERLERCSQPQFV